MNINNKKKNRTGIYLLALTVMITCILQGNAIASTTNSEQQFRELYLALLESGDTGVQDISALNLPYMTCYYIMEDVKRNEGFVAYQCYKDYNLITVDKMETKENTPYLSKFHLSQEDSGFQERYNTVRQLISDAQKNLDEKMTDLDKLLYFHEYVVDSIYYKDTSNGSDHLGGSTLAQGYGVCEGYAKALMLFLKSENIPCEILSGGSHAWVAVKIDGEWYHVDPTWDDTTSSSYGTHYFLMRNDDEFTNTMAKKHAKWRIGGAFVEDTQKISLTSTNYTFWYVHEIRNRMYYYDGYWYYVLHNSVRKNNIQGTDESIIYEGQNPKITGLNDGVLTITSAGKEQQFHFQKKTTVTTTTSTTPPEPLSSPVAKEPTSTQFSTSTQTPDANQVPTHTYTPDANQIPTYTQTPDATILPATSPETPSKPHSPNKEVSLKRPIIKSLTNQKGKKLQLILKKKVIGATGYEVIYSTNKKFKKPIKKVKFSGKRKMKITGNLHKNKVYYVKVAAYKKDSNGKFIYSSYSNVKKVKIKK